MKIVAPEATPVTIAKTRICTNPRCQKHDTYRTFEIHETRYQRLLAVEGEPAVVPHSYKRAPTPVEPAVVSHSYERALTPVEPPSLPLTPYELMQKRRGRRYDALRAEGLSQADAGKQVDAETDEEVATWDAEAEFARNVAQNRDFRVLEAKLKNAEIDTNEFDRLKRELYEG
jgi:hypothetical protein